MIEIAPNWKNTLTPVDTRPYVVSSDIEGLITRYAPMHGLRAPDPAFFTELHLGLKEHLEVYFPGRVEIIEEEELREGMTQALKLAKHPLLAIDKTFTDCAHPSQDVTHFEMTRMVDGRVYGDEILRSIDELRPRPHAPSIEKQLERLQTPEINPITVVDDVVFSAKGLVQLAHRLSGVNRPINQVIAAIGIGEGIKRLKQEAGIPEVICYKKYPEVVDEICERDFFAGIPYSGRIVDYGNGNYKSAPYFEPFGKPFDWATIEHKNHFNFSVFCFNQSILLWREMERLSGDIRPAVDFHPRSGSSFWPIEGVKHYTMSKALEKVRDNYIANSTANVL